MYGKVGGGGELCSGVWGVGRCGRQSGVWQCKGVCGMWCVWCVCAGRQVWGRQRHGVCGVAGKKVKVGTRAKGKAGGTRRDRGRWGILN